MFVFYLSNYLLLLLAMFQGLRRGLITIFFELIINLLDQRLPRIDWIFVGFLIMFPVSKGKRSLFLILGVKRNQILFKHGELVLAVQKHSAPQIAIFSRDEEIFIAIHKSGELRIALWVVVD